MPKYTVTLREVTIYTVEVEAGDRESAIDEAYECIAQSEIPFEYETGSDSLEPRVEEHV